MTTLLADRLQRWLVRGHTRWGPLAGFACCFWSLVSLSSLLRLSPRRWW